MMHAPDLGVQITPSTFDLVYRGLVNDNPDGTPVDSPTIQEWQCHADSSRGRGGRKRETDRYNVKGTLGAHLLAAFIGRDQRIKTAFAVLWSALSADQIEAFGLSNIVNDERRRVLIADNAWEAEYKRFHADRDHILSVINWSPYQKLGKKRRTNAELFAIKDGLTDAERADLAERQRRCDKLANALLGDFLPPPQPGYGGHMVIDSTMLRLNIKRFGTGTRADILHGADHWAGFVPHAKRQPIGWYAEIHLAKPTHSLYGEEVGHLVTGLTARTSETDGWGGATAPAVTVTDAHIRNGYGPPKGKTADAVTDRGFSNKDGLAEQILERGYLLTQDYSDRANRSPVVQLDTDKRPSGADPDTVAPPLGPIFYQGTFVCPGAAPLTKTWSTAPRVDPRDPKAFVEEGFDSKGKAKSRPIRDSDWRRFELRADAIAPMVMPTNGRPQIKGKLGAPSKDPRKNVRDITIQVGCPARLGLVTCPRYTPPATAAEPAEDQDQATAEQKAPLPVVLAPPAEKDKPTCCTQTWTTVRMTSKEFKRWQPYMYGSYEWTDRYGGARSRDEGVHANLKHPRTNTLDADQFEAIGPANITLAVLCVIIYNNYLLTRAHATASKNGPPQEDRVEWRKERGRLRHLRNENPDRRFRRSLSFRDSVDFRSDIRDNTRQSRAAKNQKGSAA